MKRVKLNINTKLENYPIIIGSNLIDNLNSYYSKKLKIKRLQILKENKNFKFFNIDLIHKKKLAVIFKKNRFKNYFRSRWSRAVTGLR